MLFLRDKWHWTCQNNTETLLFTDGVVQRQLVHQGCDEVKGPGLAGHHLHAVEVKDQEPVLPLLQLHLVDVGLLQVV